MGARSGNASQILITNAQALVINVQKYKNLVLELMANAGAPLVGVFSLGPANIGILEESIVAVGTIIAAGTTLIIKMDSMSGEHVAPPAALEANPHLGDVIQIVVLNAGTSLRVSWSGEV